MRFIISFLVPLLAAASTYAHGFVSQIDIAGKSYMGDTPGGQENPTVIRTVSSVDPVKGADNPSLGCGLNAGPASLVASANPGDNIDFHWKGGGPNPWPHNTGPMLTYMASCGDQTCDKFDSSSARWFKIQQVARTSDGKWAQADLTTGAPASVTLPSNIAPGNYLIRHEIIGLQNAVSMGGAEFYPSCSQLTVGGSGTGKPKDSELVSFPGAYRDDDPGIFDPNVYNGNSDYQLPGPPIASFVGDSGDSSSSGHSGPSTGGGSSTTTSSGSKPASSASPPPSKCTLKNSSQYNGDSAAANDRRSFGRSTSAGSSLNVKHYPRRMSRVMRNIVFGNTH